jgi:hypothetical protein
MTGEALSTWYHVVPMGHFGYPQPEDSWDRATYGPDYCIRCGIAPSQLHPFRLRSEPGAKHSDVIWINWLYDEPFIRPHVAADLAAAGITGIEALPVLRHKTGSPLESLLQLRIRSSLPAGAVLTEGLQPVTCRVQNEESHVRLSVGESRIPPDAPYCGRTKFHPPQSPRVRESTFVDTADIVRSAEWFGSGGQAFRQIFASTRMVELAKARKWRGVRWEKPNLTP